MKRSSGILMHVTSLPSRFGIGTMGRAALEWIDFLNNAGQKYWQVLPVNPTGFGDSPYQSFSTFAGNPFLIDLEMLAEEGMIDILDCEALIWGDDPESVDFERVYVNKFKILKAAFERAFNENDAAFWSFCEQNSGWLSDYAVFMAAKEANGMRAWKEWADEGLRLHREEAIRVFTETHKQDIDFYRFIQFLFFRQWTALKEYANRRGIGIIGDMPIYVAADSADAWANRENFHFNQNNDPAAVAGCPPDAFCALGQYWGNPVYNWAYLKSTGYGWWLLRLGAMRKMYDMLRIDHFRGFESYYSIAYGSPDASFGQWEKGPGMDFFNVMNARMGDYPIIAEDLGFLTEEVRMLRKQTGYPGMKVLQFAFESGPGNEYLPHNYQKNCVVYTGTHDNHTIAGWAEESRPDCVAFAKEYGRLTEKEGLSWGFIRMAFSSVADLAIAQMQDFLEMPSWARMNKPSTVGGNWRWRVIPGYAAEGLAAKIRELTWLYAR